MRGIQNIPNCNDFMLLAKMAPEYDVVLPQRS
jgi:hypothetical protein